MKKDNFYIFTGSPGSGKSSVINLLRSMGYRTIRKVGRYIIKRQLTLDGDSLPWANTVKYAN